MKEPTSDQRKQIIDAVAKMLKKLANTLGK